MEEEKEKFRLLKLVLKVVLLFIVFELIIQLFAGLISSGLFNSLKYGKYGSIAFVEGIAVLFALIFLKRLKLGNIFKKKRMNFKKSILLGIPLLFVSFVSLSSNLPEVFHSNLNTFNLISVIIYALFIGIYEETLFRGIIQNLLVEKYSENRRELIISILISSLIFGLLHFTNFLMGQDILTTLMQVVQTIALGFLLGSVYAVSDNLWSVIFLHSFYDFSILLGDVNLIKDCTYGSVPISVTLTSLVVSILLSIIYFLFSAKVLSKENCALVTKEDVEVVEDTSKYNDRINKIIIIVIFCFFGFNIFSSMFLENADKYYICYNFEEIKIDKKETHYYNYDDYDILNYKVYLEDEKAYIKDLGSNKIINLAFENVNRVVVINHYILVVTYDGIEYKVSSLYFDENINVDNINNEFKSFDISSVAGVGYLRDVDQNVMYPMFKSKTDEIFVIDHDLLKIVK